MALNNTFSIQNHFHELAISGSVVKIFVCNKIIEIQRSVTHRTIYLSINFAPHRARPQWAKVDMFEYASRLYIVPFCTCVAILSQVVNVRIVLANHSVQTVHALYIQWVFPSSTVCVVCVHGWLMHSAYKYKPCGRVYMYIVF